MIKDSVFMWFVCFKRDEMRIYALNHIQPANAPQQQASALQRSLQPFLLEQAAEPRLGVGMGPHDEQIQHSSNTQVFVGKGLQAADHYCKPVSCVLVYRVISTFYHCHYIGMRYGN